MMKETESIVDILMQLVSIPSLSGREKEISMFVYDYLDKLGVKPQLQEVYKTGYNVVAKLGRGNKLLLCGHLDTVSELDMEYPYKPFLKNGKIYGRGACDMKGGIAVMISLLEKCVKEEREPDVTFAFLVDEELHGRGAMELLARGVDAKECIILEPTSLDVCSGAAGCIEFTLRIFGQSGHGAAAFRQGLIQTLFQKLEQLFEKIGSKFNVIDSVQFPIINLGMVRGGFGGWVIPAEAEASVLIHFHPKFSFKELEEFIVSEIESTSNMKFELVHGCDGYISQTSLTDKLVESRQKIMGDRPRIRIFESESDANTLYHKGGISSIIFGPGHLANAHSSVENVEVSQLINARDILFNLLENL